MGAPGKSFSRQQKLHLLVRREREELRLQWSLPWSLGKLKGKGLRLCVASPVGSERCEGRGCLQRVGVHGGAPRPPPEASLFVLRWFSLSLSEAALSCHGLRWPWQLLVAFFSRFLQDTRKGTHCMT